MKFFLDYLKMRRKVIGVYGLFCGNFALIFWLYHLPLRAVLYPAAICATVGIVLGVFDFLNVWKRHKSLCIPLSISDVAGMELPRSENILEEHCRRMILSLAGQYGDYQAGMNKRYDDMVDYYTVWAHQIKTPIAAMGLTLQNEDTALSRKLMGELFRIEQYVEMVLMFLRLDSPSHDYVIGPCDLDGIVRQCVKKYAGEFIGRKLQLEYSPLNTTVVTDEKWLAFVIEQVLSNALKYTPAGSIRIYMEQPKTLCIRDTGMGIAPEDLPRIFEKGYTGGLGRTYKQASGIGLYLCRRICTNLGHTIRAESVPDAGTVIFIELEQEKLEVE